MRFAIPPLGGFNHALVRPIAGEVLTVIPEPDIRVAIQNKVPDVLRQVGPGGVEADVKTLGDLSSYLNNPAIALFAHFTPG